MKQKNKFSSLTATLSSGFIMSLVLVMNSNATENPFEITSLSSGYVVADGHNPAEHDQDNQAEHDQDNYKQHKCNPDKGQSCNEPSW